MKKYLFILFILSICGFCVMTSSCSSSAKTQESTYEAKSFDATSAELNSEKFDVDLTELSSTMVFAEVNNIMINPDDYLGKTIKMNGLYTNMYYEPTGLYYHYVIVEDATACCQQGLEFKLDDGSIYPEDNANVEVTGTFDTYEESGEIYYYVVADSIKN